MMTYRLYRLREQILRNGIWEHTLAAGGDLWFATEREAIETILHEDLAPELSDEPYEVPSEITGQRIWMFKATDDQRDLLDVFDVPVPTNATDLAAMFNAICDSQSGINEPPQEEEDRLFLGDRW